jgi:hypothetical protein
MQKRIEVLYKGRPLITPDAGLATRFDKVTKLDFLAPGRSALIDDADMKAAMQAEWEADWSEI